MSLREEQCKKVCRILDNVLANRPTERDSLIVAVREAFAEPKRGKWIRTGSGSLYDHYECSKCGKAPKWECMGDNRWKIAFTDFCSNCGAKMEATE